MKKHKFSSTSIELHHDGSATIHHQHESDPTKDVHHAVADLDGVHDSMEEHLNPEVEEALEEKIHPGLHQEALDKTGQEESLEEKVHPGIHNEVMRLAGKE